MKLIKFIGIALIIASIGIVTGLYALSGNWVNQPNMLPGVENVTRISVAGIYDGSLLPAEVISEAEYPLVPEKMLVYRVDRNISEDVIRKFASQLGVNGEIHRGRMIVSIGEGDYSVSGVPTSAFMEYSTIVPEPGYDPQYINTHLPSDDEAVKISDEFLDQHNIRPEGAVFYSTSHNIGHFISGEIQVKNSESINVWYKRWIDGCMILTDKLHVVVGVNGEVRKMIREWPAYEPYQEFSTIGPEEAFGFLKKTGVVIRDEMKNPEKAIVTNVSLVYIDQTNTEDFDYLIPVYYFKGTVQGDSKSAEFYQYIPAIPVFMEEITEK
jgi:hypothetical protein